MSHSRRVQRLRAKRQANQKRRKEVQQRARKLSFGKAWATIVFKDGTGFRIVALHNSRDEAEKAATVATEKVLYGQRLEGGTKAYTVYFAAPVEEMKSYRRGTPYFAAMRGTSKAVNARTVFLYETEKEVAQIVESTKDEPPDLVMSSLGGPVTLARI
jgi:hypothetical protein